MAETNCCSTSKVTNYINEVAKFKDDIKRKAEELVIKTFPRKVIELNQLLEGENLSLKNLDKVKEKINIPIPEYPYVTPVKNEEANHDSGDAAKTVLNGPQSKKRKFSSLDSENENAGCPVLVFPNGTVPCNKFVTDLIDLVKPLIRQLVDDANLLRMWVVFLIPKIEDGNNFGVSIQEDILNEIRVVEAEATAYFDQMSRYFLARAKIITKIAKYPHVEDFRRNALELDEKEFLNLRLIVNELRNQYASLHDVVTKNLEKIKKPRSSNPHSMY